MPSENYTTLKLSTKIVETLRSLKWPGESFNHFLEDLLPEITILARKRMRRVLRRRSSKTPRSSPDD